MELAGTGRQPDECFPEYQCLSRNLGLIVSVNVLSNRKKNCPSRMIIAFHDRKYSFDGPAKRGVRSNA